MPNSAWLLTHRWCEVPYNADGDPEAPTNCQFEFPALDLSHLNTDFRRIPDDWISEGRPLMDRFARPNQMSYGRPAMDPWRWIGEEAKFSDFGSQHFMEGLSKAMGATAFEGDWGSINLPEVDRRVVPITHCSVPSAAAAKAQSACNRGPILVRFNRVIEPLALHTAWMSWLACRQIEACAGLVRLGRGRCSWVRTTKLTVCVACRRLRCKIGT